MFPTAAAPANDPKNNDRSSGTLDLRQSEISKFSSILDIFDEVINVQK